MTYGETIRTAREQAGMTQEELAEQLDVSRQAVSKWEKDLSRPMTAKLVALTKLLRLPPDTWETIDRAGQERAEALRQSDSEVKLLYTLKRWKWGTLALAVLLCLSLCLNVYSAVQISTLKKAAHGMPPEQAELGQDLTETFPEMLELTRQRRSYDFGDQPLGDYDPALVPELEELAAHGKSDNTLWSGMFEDENGTATAFLQVVRTNPVTIDRTTFWDVYLVYAVLDAAGDLNWKILYRIADKNCYVNDGGGLTVEAFDNVLGYDGLKFSLTVGGAGIYYVEYITQRPDGTPCLMLFTGTTGSTSIEFDVNEDGMKEIIVPDGQPAGWEIYVKYQEWTEVYTLESQTSEGANISFDPNEGGFIVCDETGTAVARYIYRDGNWGGEMVRRPVTDVTVADYPDVAGTKLLFDLEYFNDSIDPDTLQDTADSGVRITPRQQAYLALQQLYDLTGQHFDQLYCAVDGRFGGTCFSLLEGGLSERCFYSADMPERYGGDGIPSIYFTWQEMGADWSPLCFRDITEQPDYQDAWQTKMLSWYYDQLWLMQTGAEAFVRGDGSEEQELWLANGDLFTATFQETDHGLALTCLTGPYPDGQVYH